jgi:hypothetical protein
MLFAHQQRTAIVSQLPDHPSGGSRSKRYTAAKNFA